jgi:hypothetical protein
MRFGYLIQLSLINLVNLIIWLEKKTLIKNQDKKSDNDSMQKKKACKYHGNISFWYS